MFKRKPKVTVDECLSTIGKLRGLLEDSLLLNDSLRKEVKKADNTAETYKNMYLHTLKELVETRKERDAMVLYSDKQREYIHGLNKEIDALKRFYERS